MLAKGIDAKIGSVSNRFEHFHGALPFPYVDRGKENHLVTLKSGGMIAENITSPGNSGFIRSDGTLSPHFYDQVDMFLDFTNKPMLFTDGEVIPAVQSIKKVEWK
jgi:penicillin amidase